VVRLRGAAGELVLDLLDPADLPAGRLAHERALPVQPLDEVLRDVPELGGKVLVDVEHVHGCGRG
jgi:hypothetical protein